MSDTNSRSQTLSASPSPEPSRSSTQTGSCAKTLSSSSSLSLSPNLSWTESATPSEDPSSSVTLYNGLFAAWHRSTGVYADGTSQPTRYSTSNGVVTDALTGLQWQLSPSASVMSWGNGVSSCAAASTGGYSDWRLPNNVELLTLVDYTIASTGSTPGINAVFSGTPLNYFYTSTPLVGSASKNPWWVSFGQNACYSGFLESLEYNPSCTPAVASQGYVRCVRSPSEAPLPLNRYTIESGAALGTVTDQVTGLIWQKVAPTSGGPNGNGLYTQSQAIAYCSSLNLGGSGAGTWRLPTNRELQTLVDYSKAYGSLMMDTTVFSGEPASGFWSSLVESASREWGVHFGVGLVYTSYFTNTYFVRCVR
ncbi:MAG: DUF1566 domain-containing protein [Myxococcaceae bacterium]|nr:DUF1566 domain-containing protein [Myxococcaceae bacterium]